MEKEIHSNDDVRSFVKIFCGFENSSGFIFSIYFGPWIHDLLYNSRSSGGKKLILFLGRYLIGF